MTNVRSTSPHYRRFLLGGVIVLFLLLGFGCKGGQRVIESLPQVELQFWTVWDEPDDYNELILAYRQQHPNVRINVRKFAFEEYEQRLLESWARDEGPDIFSIPNSSVGQYLEFITPLPPTLKLPTLVVTGGCSKDIRVVDEPKVTLIPERLDEMFLPVVADDVVVNNTIHALPFATDALALFYNKDLLNSAKIIAPPQTWRELVDMVDSTKSNLTQEDRGEILQSGVALGTANNINRAVDLLSVLMMQSGAQMVDATGRQVLFHTASPNDPTFNPGISALNFYTSFANPARVTYSWNDRQPDAQEAFASGKVAFFVGYSYQIEIIRRQNPQLNFGLAPLPQIALDGPEINYANYWVTTVAKKSENPNEAWDFLLFATSDPNVQSYLTATKKPTALKTALGSQREDLDLRVFVGQLLVTKSWYHGTDNQAMESALTQAITDVLEGKKPEEALSLAADRIQVTLNPP